MTAVAKVASEEDRPSERRMTFFEHIEELRQRLKVIVIVIVVLFALFLTTGIGSVDVGGAQVPMLIPALGPTSPNVATQFVVAMKNYLVPERVGGIPLNFSFAPPWDAYVVMFKVAFFLAAVVGSPVIVYELGQFIGPALKPSEKRLILRITVPVVLLFLSLVALPMLALYVVGYGAAVRVEHTRARAKG